VLSGNHFISFYPNCYNWERVNSISSNYLFRNKKCLYTERHGITWNKTLCSITNIRLRAIQIICDTFLAIFWHTHPPAPVCDIIIIQMTVFKIYMLGNEKWLIWFESFFMTKYYAHRLKINAQKNERSHKYKIFKTGQQ